ncbi:MAG TPA: Do family serine endopeptidase, partial [Chromatiales bacterium]|nr:Do family serine endopeptidase [Chromatiales bacterium]HEX22290.1 Do family serine endopeptidase [Chromatiales bacterium]
LGQSRPIVEITESTPLHTAAGSGPVSYADAVDAAAPAVVNVYTTKIVTERANPLYSDPIFRYFFGDRLAPRQRLETSLGSGVIVSDQGYILTNNHVIEGAADIQVALRDGRSIEAVLVGTDSDTDLAVLKINMQGLPTITFGSSENLRVGDVVLAIGNPFGVGQTVTIGIASATGRNRVGISTFENFIQTDAAINPGNSGGALINAFGQLVGINTAIFSRSGGSQGIGFAIPVDLAKEVMSQIIETGHVVRGWLGVEGQDITPQLAESFGLQGVRGVIIAGVQRNGPAGRAGLRPGDILTHINGQPAVDSKTSMGLIASFAPGTRITLRILRAGMEMELKAVVAERPSRAGSSRG